MEILMCACVCLCSCRWSLCFSLALVSNLFCPILVGLFVFTSWVPDCFLMRERRGRREWGRGVNLGGGETTMRIYCTKKKIYFQYKERPMFPICRITFFLKEIWKTQKVKNNKTQFSCIHFCAVAFHSALTTIPPYLLFNLYLIDVLSALPASLYIIPCSFNSFFDFHFIDDPY